MATDVDAFLLTFFLRRELLMQGWSDRAIAQMLRSKEWVRPRHGAYVSSADWRALDEPGRHVVKTRAVVRAAKTDVAVSHASGVPFWDGPTWGLDLSNVHNTRLDGKTGRFEAGVRQHCGVVLDDDVVTRHGVDVIAPARLALEVSTMAPLEAALVVVNDFLHRGLTTPEQVRQRYDLSMDHWPDSRPSEIVIRLGDPRISSVLESRFLWFCYTAGLPAPIPHYPVPHPDGRLAALLDFAWPDLGGYVETNGGFKYDELLEPGQKPGDVIQGERRREELVRELTGLRGMHVVWHDLDTPTTLERRVRAHLRPGR